MTTKIKKAGDCSFPPIDKINPKNRVAIEINDDAVLKNSPESYDKSRNLVNLIAEVVVENIVMRLRKEHNIKAFNPRLRRATTIDEHN